MEGFWRILETLKIKCFSEKTDLFYPLFVINVATSPTKEDKSSERWFIKKTSGDEMAVFIPSQR